MSYYHYCKREEYGGAWTLIVDALAEAGVPFKDQGRIADKVLEALVECTPRAVLNDEEMQEQLYKYLKQEQASTP